MNDVNHLQWMHDRLMYVHKESIYSDYMIKFREVIKDLRRQNTISKGESRYVRLYSNDWKLMDKFFAEVYHKCNHAFRHGCGKDTMAYWWKNATGITFNKNSLREYLLKKCKCRINKANYKVFTVPGKDSGM